MDAILSCNEHGQPPKTNSNKRISHIDS